MEHWPTITIIGLIGLALLIALIIWLRRGPGKSLILGALWRFTQFWNRLIHRPTYINWHHLPPLDNLPENGLIVVSNHTGAIDPFLIQARCRFRIRWMMATEMMYPKLMWFWKRIGIIPVNRDGRDSTAVREALRSLKRGEVIGIFPEGAIVVPPREVRPFQTGIGMMIARSKAPVALIWVSGTPDTNDTVGSLTNRSRSRIECLGIFDFSEERDGRTIANTLREAIATASGWPLNDELLKRGTRGEEEAG